MIKNFQYVKYLNIPNGITLSSLIIGFVSFIVALQNDFKLALTLLAIAIFFDRIDGMIARKMKSQSEFGKQLDSFSDFYNFCILPPILAYLIGFNSLSSIIVMLLYIVSGVGRLAHFNISAMEEVDGKKYFSGIPTTLSASWFLIAVSVMQIIPMLDFKIIFYLFFIGLSILMVSPIRCNKNGLLVKSLYLLIPVSLILLWIY